MRLIEPCIKVLPTVLVENPVFELEDWEMPLENFSLENSSEIRDFVEKIIENPNFSFIHLMKGVFLFNDFNKNQSLTSSVSTPIEHYIRLLTEAKTVNKVYSQRLAFLNDNIDDLMDIFMSKHAYLSYVNGFKKLEDIVNDDEIMKKIKSALECLIISCAYPCFYAILNVIVVPKNFKNTALITIPPLHIAPFEYLFSLNFCIFYDEDYSCYKVGYFCDNNTKTKLSLGKLYTEAVEYVTGKIYEDIFAINVSKELCSDPPFRQFLTVGDECELFLNYIFNIDVKKELKKRERKIKKNIGHKDTVIKDEYITSFSMSFNTNNSK